MNNQPPIQALVTLLYACARLIRMALRQGCGMRVLHIANPAAAPKGESTINAQALNYLYLLSGRQVLKCAC